MKHQKSETKVAALGPVTPDPEPSTRPKRHRESGIEYDQPRARKRRRVKGTPGKRARRQRDQGEPILQSPYAHKDLSSPQQSFIECWAQTRQWPSHFYSADGMHHILARKGSAASLGRKRSNPSLSTSDDDKSIAYRDPSYPSYLSAGVANYNSYLEDHAHGISGASEELLERLLCESRSPPDGTLFSDDNFRNTLRKVEGKNESRVIQDISLLLVPSVESLATTGAHHLAGLVESVNDGWNRCFAITKPRPQPDSSFGFGALAFTDDELDKLRPMLGDASYSSWFKATYYMYFPFLMKEVKTGLMGLDIADNQNAHSATIAVRAIVELYKLVGREKELHREAVAFSISHDDKSIRLYAHYPYISNGKVTVWRRTIDRFYISASTKWVSWRFTRNVFEIFSPIQLERLRSAIDDISTGSPLSERTERPGSSTPHVVGRPDGNSEASGLSQHLQQYDLDPDDTAQDWDTVEKIQDRGTLQQATPDTSTQSVPKSPEKKKSRRDA